MAGPKKCTACNVDKEETEYTKSQYKTGTRKCKACCSAGAAEAATAVKDRAEKEVLDAKKTVASAEASAFDASKEPKVSAKQTRKAAVSEQLSPPPVPEEDKIKNKGGKDVRERQVKSNRNLKEQGF